MTLAPGVIPLAPTMQASPDIDLRTIDAPRHQPTAASLSAAHCLVAIARHHGFSEPPDDLSISDASVLSLCSLATTLGLKTRSAHLSWPDFQDFQDALPAIARLNNGNFVVVVGFTTNEKGECVGILDPLAQPAGVVFLLERERFERDWSGEVVLLKREYKLADEHQPFGLRWFIPELLRQRQFLRDVAVAALVLHVLALAVPIFMQLVIDKVIVHQGYSTLYVLSGGVLLALMFEAVFSYLRQFYLLHATNRIDIRLARKTFTHLLHLPLTFFETGSAGVITRHMQQAEKIRQFLTGRLFTTLLDASVLLIFLPVLFFYSTKLTLVVLLFTGLIASMVFALVPTFRSRLQALYKADAERQAMLVETIQGMRTVKSLAMEPQRRRDWEDRSARTVEMHFRVGKISMTAHTAMSFLEKAMMISVIAIGAHDVFDQTLSVGALIAFQMLSGRVVSPLVQIVSLVHEYQETALSVRMLGEIMNRPTEGGQAAGGLKPQLKGLISFEAVNFRYSPTSVPALQNINLDLEAGTLVGIVGRSGSGKTTLTRLLQGLYAPQEGLIRFDGIDIRQIDVAHLRRNIGVVLQDNFLFRGSVRDNIAIAHPHASLEDVVEAARSAGADEFIERLPQGYDTLLEENGANLSGGQKQRLAIARALLGKPRILILDEAASALDPESEFIFLSNLNKLTEGRTVIMVSHRLSTLTGADGIVVMERGKVLHCAPHEVLLKECATYARLWQQQTRHL